RTARSSDPSRSRRGGRDGACDAWSCGGATSAVSPVRRRLWGDLRGHVGHRRIRRLGRLELRAARRPLGSPATGGTSTLTTLATPPRAATAGAATGPPAAPP